MLERRDPVGGMTHAWQADPSALFERRLGRSAKELGISDDDDECPDIWQLDNGDVAVIGRDLSFPRCAGGTD
jgi:hypothetical protein